MKFKWKHGTIHNLLLVAKIPKEELLPTAWLVLKFSAIPTTMKQAVQKLAPSLPSSIALPHLAESCREGWLQSFGYVVTQEL